MSSITTRRKVLVPLATLLAAGAVAVGSGATFTSQSAHSATVTAGTLHHTNDKNTKTLTVTNIKPGDSKVGSLTITNDGTLDSTLTVKETSPADPDGTFTTGDLKLKIVQTTPAGGSVTVFDGNFGALADSAVDLGALNVGQVTTLTYTVSMPTTAGNENQGATARADYQVVTTQAGDNSGITWLP